MHMHNELKVEKKVQMFGHSLLDNAPKCQAGWVLLSKNLHLFLVLAHCVYGVCFALSDEIKKRIFDVDVALLQCYVCKLFKKNVYVTYYIYLL